MLEGLYQQVCHGGACVDRTAPYQVEGDNVLDHTRRYKELLLKEALYISAASEGSHFNKDERAELNDCWITTIRQWEGRIQRTQLPSHGEEKMTGAGN